VSGTAEGERVVLLAGGDAVYLYAPGDTNIDAMEAVLDVKYPAEEVIRRTVSVAAWEASLRSEVIAAGAEIVDCRFPQEEQ
jgi:hypothetical protein